MKKFYLPPVAAAFFGGMTISMIPKSKIKLFSTNSMSNCQLKTNKTDNLP